jgi:hypothetical protein
VVADERAHVLDHADDPQEARRAMSAARWATFCAAIAGVVTITTDGARQQPGQAHLHVTGAGRHVDEQVVELAPGHVGEELLDGLGEHEPAPHERGRLLDEEARSTRPRARRRRRAARSG